MCIRDSYKTVQEISDLGLRISLDDFGIRYSNLSVLNLSLIHILFTDIDGYSDAGDERL